MIKRIGGLLGLALALTSSAALAQRSPRWVRGTTCYEVFVRSFYDSDEDGVGDIKGLTAKLDYINDGNPRSQHSLGARCIWLMPIVESPSYHGYDATDYYKVAHAYGTNDDFKQLVAEAHKRGIRVLVDMVLNHTSNEHPWFQAAMRDTTSPYRAWYRWSPTKPDQKGPWGQDVWYKSPVRDEYYYAVFWSGMPDLNYATPAVRDEAKKIARFWLEEMGVDGFRLDAVPFLMEDGGKLAGSPGTHALLHEYADYVHRVRPDAFTVGEVYDSIGTMLTYYPNQLDSYFAFEVADSIIAAVRRGSAQGLLAPVQRLQAAMPNDRWSPFLRNHDQPRTRTEVGGDMREARLASLLLLTMPGVPFVYYGEEIGMVGTKPDERIRTPMQWRRGHADGFTTGTPWETLQDDSLTTTVEAEDGDPGSVLTMNRRLIHLRSATPSLAEGTLVPLRASEEGVAAYARRLGDRVVIVVANLTTAPIREVSISGDAGGLPPGTWRVHDLLSGSIVAPAEVDTDGRLRDYEPLRELAPLEGYVLELHR
ncbi:MAG TPA: alpha-amylase family glycosyl hydrolase [Gemmatimonadaceae bacterium]|jgi:glycosidase